MKTFLITIGSIIFLSSCNDNTSKVNTDYDQSKFTPPVIAKVDTQYLSTAGSISGIELADDSVFADGSLPTSWENAGITDVKGLKLFLKELQQLVMLNDKVKLSNHVQYPLKDIQSKAELESRYDEFFTKEVKLSLATINFNQVFRNQNGVMTTGGKVWVRQVGKGFKIIAINN